MGVLDIFKKRKQKEKQSATKKEVSAVKEKKSETESKKKDEKKQEKNIKKAAPREGTGDAYKFLMRPLITEKVADLGMYGKYVFEVSPNANKVEIEKAIKKVYGVHPVKINIVNMGGKRRRFGRVSGQTKDWKKAIITLKPGDKIEVYEGV